MYSDFQLKGTIFLVATGLLQFLLAIAIGRVSRFGKYIGIVGLSQLALSALLFPILSIKNLVLAVADPTIEYIGYNKRSLVVFSLASDPLLFWIHAVITVLASCFVLLLVLVTWRHRRPNNSFKPKPLRGSA